MPCMMMMGNSLGSGWAQVNFIMRSTMNEKRKEKARRKLKERMAEIERGKFVE